jgi:high affinity sulfate transporter 1
VPEPGLDPASARQFSPTDGLRFDIVAGLTAASVVLPKAMAYATVAGLPVEVGLYTAFVPAIVYGLLGSSCVLSVSSTTTLAILTGVELATVVPNHDASALVTATATLTALVGLLLVLARLLRLGFLAHFISTPVLTGFKAGIGLVILLDQAPKLLGLHITKQSFFADLGSLIRHLPETSLPTLAVGAATIAALVLMERVRPHSPAPLLIVGIAILASWLFGLDARGVSLVGHIPQGLPRLTLPDPALVEALLPGALGIALMSFTESIAAARAFQRPADPPIRPNQELVATGTANLAGALFGAMPAGGGTSQTGVVRAAGGRTRKTSLVVAATALATMLFLAGLLGMLPNATLAALVIVYSASLIQPAEFRDIRRVRGMEFGWAVVAGLGVLIFGTLQGIVVAIVLSLLSLGVQIAHPRVSIIGRKRDADVLRPLSKDHPDDETIPGLLILRPEGRLFFLNAQTVADRIKALTLEYRPRVLVLDMSRVPDLEYSALDMLRSGTRNAADSGPAVWLAGLNPSVLDAVRRVGLDAELGRDRLLFNAREAIRRYCEGEAGATPQPNSTGTAD